MVDGFDAVVVGSGPNGLIGAATLARAGLKVLLLEAADELGGGLRSGPLTGLDGFTHDFCATVLPLARLPRHSGNSTWTSSGHTRRCKPRTRSTGRTRSSSTGTWRRPRTGSAHAATRSPGGRRVGAAAGGDFGLVDSLLSPLSVPRAPIRLARYGALGILPATVLGRALFTGERARAALAGMAAHSMVDLRRPITGGYGLLLAALAHQVGWPVVRGGSARLAEALVSRFTGLGGVAETGHLVKDLADLPPAPIILLDLTPRQVLGVCGERLPPRYARRLREYRYGPGVFKLDWALSGPVPWRDPAVGGAATVHLGGTLGEIAHAEAEVAAGRHPERPYVLAVQPCAADPSRAPGGRHVLWAYCHVPNGSVRDMTTAVEDQVERFAPGFRDLILARAAHDTAAMESHNPKPCRRRHRRRLQRPVAVRPPPGAVSAPVADPAARRLPVLGEHAAWCRGARHGRLPRRPACARRPAAGQRARRNWAGRAKSCPRSEEEFKIFIPNEGGLRADGR